MADGVALRGTSLSGCTGMPGFGPTHSDSAIWAMVAFLQRLQTLTSEEYKAFENSQRLEKTETREHDIVMKNMKTKK